MHLFDVDVPNGPVLMESRTTAPGDKVNTVPHCNAALQCNASMQQRHCATPGVVSVGFTGFFASAASCIFPFALQPVHGYACIPLAPMGMAELTPVSWLTHGVLPGVVKDD